jgi:hypothetical protein
MRMSLTDVIIASALIRSPRPIRQVALSRPGVPMADFVAWATRKQTARLQPTTNGVDDDGWQDWPPDESSTEPPIS